MTLKSKNTIRTFLLLGLCMVITAGSLTMTPASAVSAMGDGITIDRPTLLIQFESPPEDIPTLQVPELPYVFYVDSKPVHREGYDRVRNLFASVWTYTEDINPDLQGPPYGLSPYRWFVDTNPLDWVEK